MNPRDEKRDEGRCPKCSGRLSDEEVATMVRCLGISEAELRAAEDDHFREHKVIPQHVWEVTADPSVPPGVIVFVDPDGTRHPMPLVEFDL